MGLTTEQSAKLNDRERVWQVRRFCQILYTETPIVDHTYVASREISLGDTALCALLRCVLHELGADLAAVSLLDEKNQFFLSVVHSATIHDPTVRRADWYGCEHIPTRGGICEKTITRQYPTGLYPIYEILDLSLDPTTKSLPVVDGRFASFRHYAGVPITTSDGLDVGALFVFTNRERTQFLPDKKQHFLWETARHTMHHIHQKIAALENARSIRCNIAVSTFLYSTQLSRRGETQETVQSVRAAYSTPEIYKAAARLICETFDLEGVIIESLRPPRKSSTVNTASTDDLHASASYTTTENNSSRSVESATVDWLLQAFPRGVILQLVSEDQGGVFVASTQDYSSPRTICRIALCRQLRDVQQCIFMPLWDGFHNRDNAFVLGWTSSFTRIYSSTTDLPSLSHFSAAIAANIQRLEAQTLSRKKADFLGSLSHEMLSPLHGILACIDHLQSTTCSTEQLDLLESAEQCGHHLKANLSNLLEMSSIGAMTSNPDFSELPRLEVHPTATSLAQSINDANQSTTILSLLADAVAKTVRRKSQTGQYSKSQNVLVSGESHAPPTDTCGMMGRPIITVDADLEQPDLYVAKTREIEFVVNSLLDNCLKFTCANGCIRISVHIDSTNVNLLFVDSGQGISSDFVHNCLFEPFAQQDPLDSGLGLGLALTNNIIGALNGQISVETDELVGTKVSVSLPRDKIEQKDAFEPQREQIIGLPFGHDSGTSLLNVRLFGPTKWKPLISLRDKRSHDALSDSLACTFREWPSLAYRPWQEDEKLPQICILVRNDVQSLKAVAGTAFKEIWKVILCPGLDLDGSLAMPELGIFAVIIGPVTASKIRAALQSCRQLEHEGVAYRDKFETESDHQRAGGVDDQLQSLGSLTVGSAGLPKVHSNLETPVTRATISTHQDVLTRDPRFLLVDDNAINLKVIAMYAKKCSQEPFVLASSGQQAIDAFNVARIISTNDTSYTPFDIILLDLSMPEVSGFDVARTIRQIEQSEPQHGRTYIAALTGLVSDKDRSAAFAAGVDEYVTKPAQLKALRSVVANWRTALEVRP